VDIIFPKKEGDRKRRSRNRVDRSSNKTIHDTITKVTGLTVAVFGSCLICLLNFLVGLILYSFYLEICSEYYKIYRSLMLTICM